MDDVTSATMDGMAHPELVGLRLEGVPAARIGPALRARRTAELVSQGQAAAACRMSVRELDQIEAGTRTASPSTVASLLALYRCTVDELLPQRRLLDPELLAGLPDRQVLQHYVALIRQWRGVSSAKRMLFRSDDLVTLVGILGTDADEIERRLIAITGCTTATARRFRRLLVMSLALPLAALSAAAIVPGLAGAHATAPVPQATRLSIATRPAVHLAPIPPATRATRPATPPTTEMPPTTATPPPTTTPPTITARPAAPATGLAPAKAAVSTTSAAPVAVVAGEEATVAIPTLHIDLPVVEGGQSIIDEGVVAHYVGAGWLAPVAAGARGTYWLAAHHVTHGGPFDALPNIKIGDEVVVKTSSHTFVYTVTGTQVVGIYAGYGPVYGSDPSARKILLQTCLNATDRFLVHGVLTSES
jgi:LPXTG-site transpeptidase (sortase) family protein